MNVAQLDVTPRAGWGGVFPNIAGQCDVADTSCPGVALHTALPELRSAVARLTGL